MSPNQEAVEHYAKGIQSSIKGHWAIATEEFKEALNLDPTFAEAHYSLGICYMRNPTGVLYGKGYQPDLAVQYLRNAIKFNDHMTEAYLNLGYFLMQSKMYQEAIKEFLNALRTNPNSIPAHLNLGIAYDKVQSDDFAVIEYERVLKMDPHNLTALFNLANIHYKQENYQSSIKLYNQVLHIKPDHFEAMVNRGLVYAEMKDFEVAISNLQQALQTNPEYLRGYLILGVIYAKSGDRIQAFKIYESLSNKDKNLGAKLMKLIDQILPLG
jgi:tetratricopeptide (TPR) repeat protein